VVVWPFADYFEPASAQDRGNLVGSATFSIGRVGGVDSKNLVAVFEGDSGEDSLEQLEIEGDSRSLCIEHGNRMSRYLCVPLAEYGLAESASCPRSFRKSTDALRPIGPPNNPDARPDGMARKGFVSAQPFRHTISSIFGLRMERFACGLVAQSRSSADEAAVSERRCS